MTSEHRALRKKIAPLFDGLEEGRIAVYLFGSRATGYARQDSDYDFALVAPGLIGRERLESLRERLEDALEGDVDCVDLRSIPLTLAAQVLESGLILIPGDTIECARLETRLMSMYAALNEERRGILEDAVKRGSIYAR
jgi:predicted nucleotidyltransferase